MARGRQSNNQELGTDQEEVRSRSSSVSKTGRRSRGPVGAGLKLSFTGYKEDPNYFYYAPTDKPGNLKNFESHGFEYVVDNNGDKVTADGGGGLTHYLMRQPREYREEDLQLADDDVRLNLEAHSKVGKGEYIPGGQTEVLRERTIQ